METKRRPRMKEQVDSIKSHTEFRRTDTEVRLDLTNRRLFTTPERVQSGGRGKNRLWGTLK